MKCEAIFANSSGHSLRKMCKVLGLREAVYYRWKKAEERRNRRIREEREDNLTVKEVYEENHRIYGCRRMRQALENRGKIMSEWRIRRIMRERGLYPEQRRKFKAGRRGKSEGRYCENAVQQQFSPVQQGKIRAGDITYLKTKLGWGYLAVVIDMYNQESQQKDRRGTGLPGTGQCDRKARKAENAGIPQRQGVSVQQQTIPANAPGVRDQRQYEQAGISV